MDFISRKGRFLDKIIGEIFTDKDYIGKELAQMLFIDGVQLITQIKNNIKNCLITISNKILLRKQSVIEMGKQ
uniref:transposase n=1 Tax=Tenacibaculum sediminilitoris TaxID=1820334 RepID=UPI0038B52B8E